MGLSCSLFRKCNNLHHFYCSIVERLREGHAPPLQRDSLDKLQFFLQIPLEKCGLGGSTTRVVKSYESSVGRRFCKFTSITELDGLIKTGLEKVNETRTVETGEKLDEAYFVGEVESVANSVAKKAIPLNVTGRTPEEIANELVEKGVKTVLWEDSDALKTLAARVAVLTEAGLCADCISFRVEGGWFIMTRPAFGGNITADIVNTGKIAFATVRTVKRGGSDLVFTVGKGGVAYLDKITALAARYGAEVCASRIVVDSGKMPYETQVGLTGKSVSPKVYVAFGVSGAVQHTCAIAGAGTVIAVNVDKTARIFDYADFGIVEDIKNLPL
jgi:electron transfer flavoprotein alpha subunit